MSVLSEKLSMLNAELNDRVGLDLGGEDGGCQMSVDKTGKLSMLITELNEMGLNWEGGGEDGGCQMSVDKTRELSMVITELNELGLDLGRMASTSNQWTRQRSLC